MKVTRPLQPVTLPQEPEKKQALPADYCLTGVISRMVPLVVLSSTNLYQSRALMLEGCTVSCGVSPACTTTLAVDRLAATSRQATRDLDFMGAPSSNEAYPGPTAGRWNHSAQTRSLGFPRPLWRGSLLPLGCAAAPKGPTPNHPDKRDEWMRPASLSNGSKLPRHKVFAAAPAPVRINTAPTPSPIATMKIFM